jgi:hypothetical protein
VGVSDFQINLGLLSIVTSPVCLGVDPVGLPGMAG